MDEAYLRSIIGRFNQVITPAEGIITGGFGEGLQLCLAGRAPARPLCQLCPANGPGRRRRGRVARAARRPRARRPRPPKPSAAEAAL